MEDALDDFDWDEDLSNCCRLYQEFFAKIRNPPEDRDRCEEVHRCPWCGEEMIVAFVKETFH